jgi:hypothetical protein
MAFKLAIDWETMRRQKKNGPYKTYDAVWKAIKDAPEAESWEKLKLISIWKPGNQGQKISRSAQGEALSELSVSEEGRRC